MNKIAGLIAQFAVLGIVAGALICLPSCTPQTTQSESTPAAVPSVPTKPDADAHECILIDPVTSRPFYPVERGGEYCFYLPGGVQIDSLILSVMLGENYSATVNGVIYEESVEFDLNAALQSSFGVTFTSKDGTAMTRSYTVIPSSANVLWLNIDPSKGSVDAMHGDSSHETYCYGTLSYIATDAKYDFSSSFSLKGRGNATWDDAKKGYALKLYRSDDYTDKNKIALSGMGESANWVLLANHRDRTLLRNALASTLAKALGMEYAVDYVFADLYLNGEYLGLYMIYQKIESGKEQVDIREAKTDSPDGGYLLEFDNYKDTPQIKLEESGQRVTVKSPDDLESYTAIEELLNQAEKALCDPDGYNKDTGLYWYDYIDTESFAILWMVREYTMDNDATVNFRFYYDPEDGKFHGGPAWDFDNSMARNAGVFADPEFALIESGHRNADCWLRMLMAFAPFREEICRLYNEHVELFTTEDEDSIYAMAYRLQKELSLSIEANFTVWESQLAYPNWNMPDEPTYEGHFGILTDFLKRRNAFWSEYIPALAE